MTANKKQTSMAELAEQARAMGGQAETTTTAPAMETAQPARPEPPPVEQVESRPQAPAPAPVIALPVRRGRIFKPRRIIIHGDAGVGKSTLAANVDDALFFDLNNGTEVLDVARYVFRPDDQKRGHVPNSLDEFMGGLRAIHKNPTGIQWLVVDMYTDLERLAMLHILRRDAAAEGKETLHSLESYGYGKGKQVLYDEMRGVFSAFDKLTARGVGVVLIAHSMVVKRNNPEGADYDVHVIRALDAKEISLSSYAFGWADEVFYLHFDDKAAKLGGKGRDKGITGGSRVLECDHAATWDAKARLPLPARVKVASASPWQFMRAALDKAYRASPAEIRQEILGELSRICDPELAVNVDIAVKDVGDNLDKLTAYMQELRRRPAVEQDEDGATTGATKDDEI